MKRTLSFLMILALVLFAAAAPAMAEEKTTVQVMSWWDITNSAPLQELERAFEEANPDIDLEFPRIASGYADKISTIVASGGDTVPDVMMLAMDLVPKFADAGAIQALDGYMTDAYKESLYPLALDALTVNGSVYAAARDVSPMVMYLNTALFAQAGIEIPSQDWTIDEFVEIAQALTKYDDSGMATQWGYYFPKYADTIYDWIIAFGGRLISEDGTTSMVGSAETKQGLQFMHDLIYKYGVTPTEAQHSQYGTSNFAAFLANKVGMQIAALSFSSSLAAQTPPIEYAVLPLPTVNGEHFTHAFVNTWTIPTGAKNPELSWRVIEFLSGTAGQQIALDYGMGMPASKDVDTTAFVSKRADNQVFVDVLSYALPFETNKHGAEFNTEMKAQLEALWLDQVTVDEVAASVDAACNFLLSGDK